MGQLTDLWQKSDNDSEEDGPDVGPLLEGVGEGVLVVDFVREFGNRRHDCCGAAVKRNFTIVKRYVTTVNRYITTVKRYVTTLIDIIQL